MDLRFKLIVLLVVGTLVLQAQTTPQPYQLPGLGLKQHPFLYAGEWDTRHPESQSMFLVKGGKVVWKYSIPIRTANGNIQEFDDITMLSNGNIVFACMSGAGIITPEKNLVWEFHCPEGTETHSCQPIGKDSVLMALNGNPGKVLIFNTATNKLLKEIVIPASTANRHVQFRHVRITPQRTIMVPQMQEGKVVEYTLEGKEIWSVEAKSAWSAIRLHNGNTLISGDGKSYTREVNPRGEAVWEFTQADAPFKLYNNQTANRLANGNTVICNWVAGNKKLEEWSSSVQVFEVTPGKKIVWALSSWDKPDLGPATCIQLLDEPGNPDDGSLQR